MPTPTAPSPPRPAIHVDGIPQPELSADLLELTIEESMSSPARCLARFNNLDSSGGRGAGFKYFALNEVDFGRRLAGRLGEPALRMFEGRVQLMGGVYPAGRPPELVLEADDGLQALHLRQRTRIFEHMSNSQMIEAIAAEHRLGVAIGLSGAQPVHAQTAQLNQSDAAFLFDRVMAAGGEVWIDQQTIVVTDSAPPATPAALVYGDSLEAFTVQADAREQRTALGVSGWDMRTKQVATAVATEADLPPGDGSSRSGGRTVADAFGQAVETITGEIAASADEARSLAVAHYLTRSANFITGCGVAVNAPGLRAGRAIDLRGLGPLFSGIYQVTRVRHHFNPENGLRTTFDVRRARIGRPRRPARPEETPHADQHSRTATDSRATSPAAGRARSNPRRAGRSWTSRP